MLNDQGRKRVDMKKEDGSKDKLLLYYDGESISGQVCVSCMGRKIVFWL